jgi:eukaryotic-like serine/threonine-protein kinase
VAAALETPNFPQIIGRYVLYGAIASGGMATVHFGRLVGPAGFARPVAIKRLHAQFARDPEFVKMFLDEARLAARVSHPNVVQTLDLVEATDEVFLVMDYVRGLALASLVRTLRAAGTRIPSAIAIGILVGVLEGLHAAHEAKNDMGERLDLVHRDVSPQNILVGTDGVARLLDFGVAKAAGRAQSTRDGQVKGKVAYMAPEQVQGHPLTRRTDIFAASVVLWEILTGRRLFFGDSDADSLRRVLNDEVPLPSSIVPELPPELDCVVMRGLERDAAKRYATAHDMALDLGAFLSPAPAAAIGEWVERTAATELGERASRIAAIERSAAESLSRMTDVAAIPGAGAPDAPTPIGKRLLYDATRHGNSLSDVRTESLRRATTKRDVNEPPPRRRTLVVVILGVALAFGLLLVLLRARHHAPYRPSAPPSGSSAIAGMPGTASGTASASLPGTAPASLRPPGESSRTMAADAGTVLGAPSSKAAPPVGRSAIPTPAPGRPVPPASSHEAAKPGCDPPYTEDAEGHIHFKPSCM